LRDEAETALLRVLPLQECRRVVLRWALQWGGGPLSRFDACLSVVAMQRIVVVLVLGKHQKSNLLRMFPTEMFQMVKGMLLL
jgi:hypothetical protein